MEIEISPFNGEEIRATKRAKTMNSAIEKIVNKLRKYPDLKFTVADDMIIVDPKDDKGFSVALKAKAEEFVVSADFWHEHFDKEEEEMALSCFVFLLSDACRLRVKFRGKQPETWTVESFENGQWVADETTGLFNLKFWQPTRVEYFQNRVIKTSDD